MAYRASIITPISITSVVIDSRPIDLRKSYRNRCSLFDSQKTRELTPITLEKGILAIPLVCVSEAAYDATKNKYVPLSVKASADGAIPTTNTYFTYTKFLFESEHSEQSGLFVILFPEILPLEESIANIKNSPIYFSNRSTMGKIIGCLVCAHETFGRVDTVLNRWTLKGEIFISVPKTYVRGFSSDQVAYTVIKSSSSDKVWTINLYEDGTLSCDCPSWKFHGKNCKHVKQVKDNALKYLGIS